MIILDYGGNSIYFNEFKRKTAGAFKREEAFLISEKSFPDIPFLKTFSCSSILRPNSTLAL